MTRYQAAYKCDQCGYLQIGCLVTSATMNGTSLDLQDDLEWWPKRVAGADFEDVPAHIGEAAAEAHRCFSIDAHRAAGALARAVVEATAKEKGISKGPLYEKIEKLHKQEHIRGHIKEAAHEIRHLGNDVAHGDFVEPVSMEEAEEILVLMGEVLQEVFQSPARIARRRAEREAKAAGQ